MKLPPFRLAEDVAVVELRGDAKTRPEPLHVRIAFPGGDVDVVRTTDGGYWVHVRVDRPEAPLWVPGESVAGQISDARLDGPAGARDVAVRPEDYHLAVRVDRAAEAAPEPAAIPIQQTMDLTA